MLTLPATIVSGNPLLLWVPSEADEDEAYSHTHMHHSVTGFIFFLSTFLSSHTLQLTKRTPMYCKSKFKLVAERSNESSLSWCHWPAAAWTVWHSQLVAYRTLDRLESCGSVRRVRQWMTRFPRPLLLAAIQSSFSLVAAKELRKRWKTNWFDLQKKKLRLATSLLVHSLSSANNSSFCHVPYLSLSRTSHLFITLTEQTVGTTCSHLLKERRYEKSDGKSMSKRQRGTRAEQIVTRSIL